MNSLEEQYSKWIDNLKEEIVEDWLVLENTYIDLSKANKPIGMIDIRYKVNGYLLNFGDI